MKPLLLATLLGISAIATRADFRDNDLFNVNINKISGFYEGEFDLVNAGAAPDSGNFVPLSSVSKAVATFDIHANGNHDFLFDIKLDDIFLFQNVAISGPNTDLNLTATLDGSGPNDTAILAALAGDGKLKYKFIRTDNDEATLNFSLADLVVEGKDVVLDPNAVTTPDAGSTLALAGIGLAAIASLRKKLAN